MGLRTTLSRITAALPIIRRTSRDGRSSDSLRLFVLVLLWAATYHGLSAYGAPALPRAISSQLTLEAFLALVHLVTMAVALGAARLLLRDARETLALGRPSGRAVGTVLGLTPAAFVLVTSSAFLIARPTLLEELVRGGQALVQRSTGRFGRELTESPALLALLWGALLSPVSEELFFRGGVWTLARNVVAPIGGLEDSRIPGASLPVEFFHESAVLRAARAVSTWLFRDGGAATLFVAALFGVVHHDMPGGLGIVRFVSALGLGLACGLARQYAGSVVAPILLHVSWNALSIAAVRRWIVSETFPMKYGAPTLVTAVAVVGVVVVVAGRTAGRTSSAGRAL
jgi:membrane protease YdiL (CAAX protease family)